MGDLSSGGAGKLESRIPSMRSMGRSALAVTTGVGAGQVVAIAASPLLTRLFGPGEFGTFAVLSAATILLAVVATMRLELAIPLAPSNRSARTVLGAALLSAAVITGMSLLVVLVATPTVSSALGSLAYARWLWTVPVAAFFFASYDALSQYAVRRRRYRLLGRRSFGQSSTIAGAQLLFGILAFPGGLLFGQLAGKAAMTSVMVQTLGLRVSRRPPRTMVHALKEKIVEYRRFPLVLLPSAFLNTLGLQLPVVLFSATYGMGVVGAIALTQRVLAAPAALLGQAVSNVYMGESAASRRSKHDQSRLIFFRASAALAAVSLVVFGAAALLAPLVFPIVFGDDWGNAGAYASALCLAVAAQFVVVPVSQTLILTGRQALQLRWDAARVVAIVASILVPAGLGADALTSVLVFSATSAVAYAVLWLFCALAVRRPSGSTS